MRTLFIFLAHILALANMTQAADWTGFKGCGIYKVDGVVRSKNNSLVMVVNEKTKSEITLFVPIDNEPKLAPYVDMPFSAEIEIKKAMNGSIGKGVVKEIKSRLPHPLNPMDTGIHFVQKSECVK